MVEAARAYQTDGQGLCKPHEYIILEISRERERQMMWWKPGAPRRMLIKAAALIVAEIERLDRAAAKKD